MKLALALLLGATTAHADSEDQYGMFGAGTAISREPGWSLRAESRVDNKTLDADEEDLVVQTRIGVDFWRAGGEWGLSFPLAYHIGGQANNARMSLGGGLSFFAFTGGTAGFIGAATYASSSVEIRRGKLVVSLDARLNRHLVVEGSDFNAYSVLVMLGRR